MTRIRIKRVYDKPQNSDGYRVLVDRLWPRGVKKENLHYDVWIKELSPSSVLRKWYHQDPEGRWSEFKKKYKSELRRSPKVADFISRLDEHSTITLIYAAQDTERNHAVVLKSFLESTMKKQREG